MPRSGPAALTSLETLFETKRGKVQAMVVTATAGAKRLFKQTVPDSVDIRALWGKLIDLRRGGSHLFLRYSLP